MQKNIEALTMQLIELPKIERLEIVRFLLFLDGHTTDLKDTDISWNKEITNRVQAVNAGTAVTMDYNDAIKKIQKKYKT